MNSNLVCLEKEWNAGIRLLVCVVSFFSVTACASVDRFRSSLPFVIGINVLVAVAAPFLPLTLFVEEMFDSFTLNVASLVACINLLVCESRASSTRLSRFAYDLYALLWLFIAVAVEDRGRPGVS